MARNPDPRQEQPGDPSLANLNLEAIQDQELRQRVPTKQPSEPPSRHIPQAAGPLTFASNTYELGPEGMAELFKAESSGDPNAVGRMVSVNVHGKQVNEKAVGRGQTLPSTMTDPGYGIEPARDFSQSEKDRISQSYFNVMLNRYNGDHEAAIVAYHAGPGTADKWVQSGRTMKLGPETLGELNKLGPKIARHVRRVSGDVVPPEHYNQDQVTHPQQGPTGAPLDEFHRKIMAARSAGVSWETINTYFAKQREQARAAGVSDDVFDRFLGLPAKSSVPPARPDEGPSHQEQLVNKYGADFVNGMQQGVEGLDKQDAVTALRPDLPMVDRAWNAMKRIGALAVTMIPIASAIGPRAEYNEEAEKFADRYREAHPEMGSWDVFFKSRAEFDKTDLGQELWRKANMGMVGALGAMAPPGIAIRTPKEFIPPKATAPVSPEHMIDAAVSIYGKPVTAESTQDVLNITRNLGQHYAETGEHPVLAAARANADPVFRQKMQIGSGPLAPGGRLELEGGEAGTLVVQQPIGKPRFARTTREKSGYGEGVTIAKDTGDIHYFARVDENGKVTRRAKVTLSEDGTDIKINHMENAAGNPQPLTKSGIAEIASYYPKAKTITGSHTTGAVAKAAAERGEETVAPAEGGIKGAKETYYKAPSKTINIAPSVRRAANELMRARGDEPVPEGGAGQLVNFTKRVPYDAGSNEAGGTTYIGSHILRTKFAVKRADGSGSVPLSRDMIAKYLSLHEQAEREAMEDGVLYPTAHKNVGLETERQAAEADGWDWQDYQEQWKKVTAVEEHEMGGEVPSDIYRKPYEQSNQEHLLAPTEKLQPMAPVDPPAKQPPQPPQPPQGETPPPSPPPQGWNHLIDGFVWKDKRSPIQKMLYNLVQARDHFYRTIFKPTLYLDRLWWKMTKGIAVTPSEAWPALQRLTEGTDDQVKSYIAKGFLDPKTGKQLVRGLEQIYLEHYQRGRAGAFENYMIARRAQEMHAEGLESGIGEGTGFSDSEVADNVVKEGRAEFEKSHREVVEWRNATMRYAREAGLITRDQEAFWLSKNQESVPFHRHFAADEPVSPGGRGKKLFHEMVGSKRQLTGTIFEQLVNDAYRRVAMANNNRAAWSLFRIAEVVGAATRRGVEDTGGGDPAAWFGDEEDTLPLALGKVKDNQAGEYGMWLANKWAKDKFRLGPDELALYENGQAVRAHFNDPEIMQYFAGNNRDVNNIIYKMARNWSRFTRASIMSTGVVPAHIGMMEMVLQSVLKPGLPIINVLPKYLEGMFEILTNGKGAQMWRQSGAAEGTMRAEMGRPIVQDLLLGSYNESHVFRNMVWNSIHHPISPIQWLKVTSEALINGMRVGAFKQFRRAGMPVEEAAARSTDYALHRGHFGGPVLQAINSLVPFTAATVNGTNQIVRALLGGSADVLGKQQSTLAFYTKAMSMVTLPAIATHLAYRNEPWYKAMQPYEHNRVIPIQIGNKVVKYTMPPQLYFLFGRLPIKLLDTLEKTDPHAFDEVVKEMTATFVPPAGIQAFGPATPVIEHIAGFSFFRDRPMVPRNLEQNVLTPYQYTNYTSELAKKMASLINDYPILHQLKLSPVVIDNYIDQWTAGIGAMTEHLTEYMLQKEGIIRSHDPERHLTEQAPFRQFLQTTDPYASAAPITTYYDRIHTIDQVHGTLVKLIADGNVQEFEKIMAQNTTAAALHHMTLRGEKAYAVAEQGLIPQYTRAGIEAISKADMGTVTRLIQIRKMMQVKASAVYAIYHNPNFPPAEKRQLLDMNYAWMQAITTEANRLMDKAGM